MKKLIYLGVCLSAITLIAFAPGKKTNLLSGNDSFLKKAVSIHVVFDMSKSSVDGLDSEEGYIEFNKKKKKNAADAKKWEDGWKKNKNDFGEVYTEYIGKKLKKTSLTFNMDDPESDYKLIVEPMHIETGSPVKYSSVETKLIFIETATGEEKAVIYVPPSRGVQMGPMSPTSGMRVQIALVQSAAMFAKYCKAKLK